jgi:Domain of unknown function(DUF2779)
MEQRLKQTISKFDWLSANECPAMAWFGLRDSPDPPDEAALFRMKQGQEIGCLARKLYPHGVLVSGANLSSVAELTQKLIADGPNEIFEATFLAGRFVAKADILRKQEGAWHIQEVKSRFSDTKKLGELVDDLAYTVMVARRFGLTVKAASLLLLSREYRFNGAPESLFHNIDVTKEVFERALEFECTADTTGAAIFGDEPPEPKLVSACRDCSYFETRCLGAGIEHSIFELPALHQKKLNRLSDEGIVDLARVPGDLELNERQERARSSALNNVRVVEPSLLAALEGIAWPCFYLDFETVATALPLYERHGCHQQVLTQFSVHRRSSIDGRVEHSDFLADASMDRQREVAQALVQALGNEGSIIVYSSFEKTRITALRDAFPEFASQLQGILDRLIDLHPFVANHVYHPAFKGSYSIKKVLPAIVPDLSYSDLAVRDGDTAIARFAGMARGEIIGAALEETRQQLLEYCKMDTLAMVRLHEALFNLAHLTQAAGSALA